MEQSIQDILSTIDNSINKFQSAIPDIQKLVYDELQPLVKQLEIKNGKLLNNLNNLKLLGGIQNKLEKVIINSQYKDSVNTFIDSFNDISNLNNEYFKQFNQKYKPKNTLPIIKQLSIEQTINDLVGQGLINNIVTPIKSILSQNITTGGSYADFQDQLQNHILNNDTGEGSLSKYTKQITTDAINQYNAQYAETIAQDLQFNWGRYVGSNIKTSREFCIYLTRKQWVHKSELPTIIEGNIDGHECKLSSSTGLPLGLIPDTNADNFKVRRGGYNCGHQFFWVPDSAIPENIKNKFENPEVTTGVFAIASAIKSNNKTAIASLEDRSIVIYDDVLNLMSKDVKIVDDVKSMSYFSPAENSMIIGGKNRAGNEYYQKKIFLHEGGHAIHYNQNIITFDKVSEDFKTYYSSLQNIIKGHEAELDNLLWEKGFANSKNTTATDQISILHDTLGGLTRGKYGSGHDLDYYQSNKNLSEMEVFAHSITLAKLENEYSDIHPILKQLTDAMKEYGLNILK